ncbi:MAG: ParB N-terminal domain-containing protein [Candidatus Thiodiazotropha sp. (ex Lucinoma borealis)]|nr:ParB N-terminal domain-containing protein [Candidatus Thiodiazotropha sp. (ex Lucinoma borealis)]
MPDSQSNNGKTLIGPGKVGETDIPKPIRLEIMRIKAYDRNPRHGQNPEFDRIKASIRANGLDQPLVITQRPETADYVVHSGGNTRLVALQELYAETGDSQFAHVQCMFKPWSRESDVLLAHLRENDLRGALTFIDKALAVFDIKQLLEEELDIDEISQRKLQMVLATGGYSLSHGLISRMGYAVKRLLPLIPQALNAGLGRPQVQRIRALDRAAFQLWKRHALGDEADFDEVFATLCRRYDAPEWDTGLLHGAIETEIAEQAEVSIQTVRVELDAQIAGRELNIPEFVDDNSEVDEADEVGRDAVESPAYSSTKDGNSADPKTRHEDPVSELDGDPFSGTDNETPSRSEEQVPDTLTEKTEPVVEQILTTGQTGPSDLKSLRGRAWTLAARLAQRNGIGDLVAPLSGKGLGFILRDVPDPALADQLDDDTLSQVSMVWWHLAASAEMTVAPVESIVSTLALDSVLRQALEQQDAGLLFNSVWTLDPGHTGYQLWRRLGEQDWSDLLNLMDTYRRIHHLAEESETRLWE